MLVRWSNAGGNADVPDKVPDIRGMAVKFRLPDGTATDLLGQTSRRFPTDSPENFVAMTEASRKPALVPLFLLRHPRMAAGDARRLRSKAVALDVELHRAGVLPDPRVRLADAAGARTLGALRVRGAAVTKPDRLSQTFAGPTGSSTR